MSAKFEIMENQKFKEYKETVRFFVEAEWPYYPTPILREKEEARVNELCKTENIDSKSCKILIKEAFRKIDELDEEQQKARKERSEIFF